MVWEKLQTTPVLTTHWDFISDITLGVSEIIGARNRRKPKELVSGARPKCDKNGGNIEPQSREVHTPTLTVDAMGQSLRRWKIVHGRGVWCFLGGVVFRDSNFLRVLNFQSGDVLSFWKQDIECCFNQSDCCFNQ